MKLHILIGTLVAMVLVASCAAEPEEVAPTTVAEEVTTEAEELAVPVGNETDVVAPDDVGQEVLDAGASASTSSTPPATPGDAAAVEAEDGGSTDQTAPAAEDTEPTVPEATLSELPEPGGPWIDPRQPDLTKTVPPPQR
ncbi:MAG: hypothetical protein QNL12_00685 [Acidimicrobiia bacterium]|nr:hypothetical protein [Acidimicrobiia bacterium]